MHAIKEQHAAILEEREDQYTRNEKALIHEREREQRQHETIVAQLQLEAQDTVANAQRECAVFKTQLDNALAEVQVCAAQVEVLRAENSEIHAQFVQERGSWEVI